MKSILVPYNQFEDPPSQPKTYITNLIIAITMSVIIITIIIIIIMIFSDPAGPTAAKPLSILSVQQHFDPV